MKHLCVAIGKDYRKSVKMYRIGIILAAQLVAGSDEMPEMKELTKVGDHLLVIRKLIESCKPEDVEELYQLTHSVAENVGELVRGLIDENMSYARITHNNQILQETIIINDPWYVDGQRYG